MKYLARRPSRSARRPLLTLEPLEDRLLLAGNLLVTTQMPGYENYQLMQFTPQGNELISQTQSVQQQFGHDYEARGLSVDPSGNVDIFDGTLTPTMSTFSPATQNWSYQTVPGWGSGLNKTDGEVAAYKNYVFASNQGSSSSQSFGIIRFDSAGGTPETFASGSTFTQVTLGLDGYLYALENDGDEPVSSLGVQVFNPDTLDLVRTFTLKPTFLQPSDIRSIAVDGAGNVYAAAWNDSLVNSAVVSKYDSNGNHVGTDLKLNDNQIPMNIALDTDGQIAVGGSSGNIYLTNESLSSFTTIKTFQWYIFVTFDHYIGTAPQPVTPSFSNLAGPTIPYGQSTATLGGQISASAAIPPGSVNITLDGVMQSAAINAADGTFSSVFDTSTLGVSNSPYTITYSYPATGNYTALTDTSKSLTVNSATTTLNNLSSPTIVIGTPNATLSGTVGSNSVLPVGQAVSVTIAGANGPLVKGSGTIGSDGNFQATLDTSALLAGAYTIQYQYAGDTNFAGSSGAGTLQVTYNVNLLSNNTKPVRAGHTLSIKLQVTDASGNNLSSADLAVTAISIVGPNGTTYTPRSKGKPNPNNVFSYAKSSYSYSLDTAGLTPGTYSLMVKVGNDPLLHAISFVVD